MDKYFVRFHNNVIARLLAFDTSKSAQVTRTVEEAKAHDDRMWALRDLAAMLLPRLRACARAMGYALGLHGSIARDFDLITVPWVEKVAAPIDLAHALRDVVQDTLGYEVAVGYCPSQAKKPHGREGFSIHLVPPDDMTVGNDGFTSSPYIDLAIIHPRAA